MDDVTRGCLAAVVDTSIPGRRVARELAALVVRRGQPTVIVSASGAFPGIPCCGPSGFGGLREGTGRLLGPGGRHGRNQGLAGGGGRDGPGRLARRRPWTHEAGGRLVGAFGMGAPVERAAKAVRACAADLAWPGHGRAGAVPTGRGLRDHPTSLHAFIAPSRARRMCCSVSPLPIRRRRGAACRRPPSGRCRWAERDGNGQGVTAASAAGVAMGRAPVRAGSKNSMATKGISSCKHICSSAAPPQP